METTPGAPAPQPWAEAAARTGTTLPREPQPKNTEQRTPAGGGVLTHHRGPRREPRTQLRAAARAGVTGSHSQALRTAALPSPGLPAGGQGGAANRGYYFIVRITITQKSKNPNGPAMGTPRGGLSGLLFQTHVSRAAGAQCQEHSVGSIFLLLRTRHALETACTCPEFLPSQRKRSGNGTRSSEAQPGYVIRVECGARAAGARSCAGRGGGGLARGWDGAGETPRHTELWDTGRPLAALPGGPAGRGREDPPRLSWRFTGHGVV